MIQNILGKPIPFMMSLALACSLAACSSNKPKPEDTSHRFDTTATDADDNTATGDSDQKSNKLQTVHFPFDSSELDDTARDAIQNNVSFLKEHARVHVQIEGHCDQRGGIQYNIALGERRAQAAKHYLEEAGIAGSRMTIISFGKEKPLDDSENEEAYAKNRRANFVITRK